MKLSGVLHAFGRHPWCLSIKVDCPLCQMTSKIKQILACDTCQATDWPGCTSSTTFAPFLTDVHHQEVVSSQDILQKFWDCPQWCSHPLTSQQCQHEGKIAVSLTVPTGWNTGRVYNPSMFPVTLGISSSERSDWQAANSQNSKTYPTGQTPHGPAWLQRFNDFCFYASLISLGFSALIHQEMLKECCIFILFRNVACHTQECSLPPAENCRNIANGKNQSINQYDQYMFGCMLYVTNYMSHSQCITNYMFGCNKLHKLYKLHSQCNKCNKQHDISVCHECNKPHF